MPATSEPRPLAPPSTTPRYEDDEIDEEIRAAQEFYRKKSAVENDEQLLTALHELRKCSREGKYIAPEQIAVLVTALPPTYRQALCEALQIRNGKVVDHSPIFAALRGCNTATYIMSCGTAAKVTVFYVLDYV